MGRLKKVYKTITVEKKDEVAIICTTCLKYARLFNDKNFTNDSVCECFNQLTRVKQIKQYRKNLKRGFRV